MSAVVNKPAVSNSQSEDTATVITSATQNVDAATPTTTTNAVNAYGIDIIKGGSVLGESFFDAVISAYENLFSYQYTSTACLVLGLLYFAHEISDAIFPDPFVSAHSNISATHDSTEFALVRVVCALAIFVTKAVVDYKSIVATCLVFFGSYYAKPSTRNTWMAVSLAVYCMFMGSKPLEIIGLSQGFFLLTQLRSPSHKAIVCAIVLVTVFIGHERLSALATGAIKSSPRIPKYTSSAKTPSVVTTPPPLPKVTLPSSGATLNLTNT